ncbi:MAG: NAD(P)/FAD-dependent oxidoreductase [Microcystaceae cyanobacterium]
MTQTIKICILGGGFGGLYTALYLSNSSWVKSGHCEITLVERNDHFVFTPLLYELITGELQRWEIAPSYQRLLRGKKVQLCSDTVKDIDFDGRIVKLEKHNSLSYDYLVVAVGNQNRWPEISGLQDYALTFRNLTDLENLQNRLHLLETTDRQQLRVSIIGGGPNGVELACKVADRLGKRGEVRIIERGEALLKGFSSGVRTASYRALSSRKIAIEFQTNVKSIESDQITLERDGYVTSLPTDLVIWTAGVESRNWVKTLNCDQTEQGKLLTRPSLQLLDYTNVFALGDMADIQGKRQFIPATAQAAYQQAACVANNLAALMGKKKLKSFHYLHLGDMLTLGHGEAIISCFIVNLTGHLAAVIRRFAYIFRLPTSRHRLSVLKSVSQRMALKLRRIIRMQLGKGLGNIMGVKSRNPNLD